MTHPQLRFMVRPRGRLYFHCWSCDRRTDLDLAEMIQRFGEDADLAVLHKTDFTCKCGGRMYRLRIDWSEDGDNVIGMPKARLRDLVVERAQYWIRCRKAGCGHDNQIRVSMLIARLGPHAGMKELRDLKFRCKCGSDHYETSIVWVEPAPTINAAWGGWGT